MLNRFEPEPHQELARQSLEKYLDQLCAPLDNTQNIGSSAKERELMRQELRAHLLLSAAAHEELGATAEEALAAAIAGFGNPEQIGRTLAQEKALAMRHKRRSRVMLGALAASIGGYAGLVITPLPIYLAGIADLGGRAMTPDVVQLLPMSLGACTGWLLANRRVADAGRAMAAWAGTQLGICLTTGVTLAALRSGLLTGMPAPNSMTLCLSGALGAAVAWSQWNKQRPFLISMLRGTLVFGMPMLLGALDSLYIYPDYRNLHILGIFAKSVAMWAASGALTGAVSGVLSKFKSRLERYSGRLGTRNDSEDPELIAE